MDSQKDQQEQNVVENQAADLSRRQIIRGMAAIPVVMTLSNGAAAATQSQLACRATPPVATPQCVDPATTSTPTMPPLPPGATFVHTGQGTALRSLNTDNNQDCVVAVAEDGSWTFLDGTEPAGYVPVTASCYTSFA